MKHCSNCHKTDFMDGKKFKVHGNNKILKYHNKDICVDCFPLIEQQLVEAYQRSGYDLPKLYQKAMTAAGKRTCGGFNSGDSNRC